MSLIHDSHVNAGLGTVLIRKSNVVDCHVNR